MLSEQDVKDFQILYKKYYNKDISYETAYEMYSKLLALTKEIYHPMTKEGLKKLNERRKELGIINELHDE